MQDYQKRLKQYYKLKAKQGRPKSINNHNEKAKQTYFDKLYLRVFLSALILLAVVCSDRFIYNNNHYIQYELSDHMNVLKFASMFNGIFGDGLFIPSPDDIPAVSPTLYQSVEYKNDINTISDETFNGVSNAVPGVVVKIIKSDDKYSVTIKGIDDRTYQYGNLESLDFSIYSYVSEEAILGKASYQSGEYTFTLQIEEDGKFISFYEICQD